MKHYAGLDVSLKSIFVCILDENAQIIREAELKCSPESVSGFLTGSGLKIAKVGLESGSL
ncbi:MAG: transposase, partial [Chlamydiales bacterium]